MILLSRHGGDLLVHMKVKEKELIKSPKWISVFSEAVCTTQVATNGYHPEEAT